MSRHAVWTGSTDSIERGIGYALEIVGQGPHGLGGRAELLQRLEELEAEGRILLERAVDPAERELRAFQQ